MSPADTTAITTVSTHVTNTNTTTNNNNNLLESLDIKLLLPLLFLHRAQILDFAQQQLVLLTYAGHGRITESMYTIDRSEAACNIANVIAGTN